MTRKPHWPFILSLRLQIYHLNWRPHNINLSHPWRTIFRHTVCEQLPRNDSFLCLCTFLDLPSLATFSHSSPLTYLPAYYAFMALRSSPTTFIIMQSTTPILGDARLPPLTIFPVSVCKSQMLSPLWPKTILVISDTFGSPFRLFDDWIVAREACHMTPQTDNHTINTSLRSALLGTVYWQA